jgi:hypothetical protein
VQASNYLALGRRVILRVTGGQEWDKDRMRTCAHLIGVAIIAYFGTIACGAAGENWTLTHEIALLSKSPSGRGLKDENITADLYRPSVDGRVPSAVIINSSGGVSAHTEHFYARLLAEHGIAALVVDSFGPRGVRETMSNQSLVGQSQSAADAIAGFRWLAGQPWTNRNQIIVLGLSRGGSVPLDVAVGTYRINILQARDVKFAAHVAISPACMIQNENARTTGPRSFSSSRNLTTSILSSPAWNTWNGCASPVIGICGWRSIRAVWKTAVAR